jgi:hypothetical protein
VRAALKLAAGFGLAAVLLVFVLVLLAAYPNPLWMALLLAPPLILAALFLDSVRRRRSSTRRFGPPAPAKRPAPAATVEVAPAPVAPLSETARNEAAAERFNASPFRRTVAGLTKTLGAPQASILPLPGGTDEVCVTVAWDLSWYQYRVDSGSADPVRIGQRGNELDELDDRYKAWNASVDTDGRLQPEA